MTTWNTGIARFGAMLLLSVCCLMVAGAAKTAPIGWAAVDAMGVTSTTGGGGGDVVIARDIEELREYAGSDEPLTILIEGQLTGSGNLRVASNKTLLGVGASASISGAELSLNDVSNVIIRNLTMSGARDAIALRGSHHVWVDHCDLSECEDGLLDITRASDYVTVSWTRFSNHRKTMLINSGTDHPEDVGKLNTTVHHCWFDGSTTRNPRVGYGKVHIFNSLYRGNGYGIGLHSQARVLADRNYFDGVKDPVRQMYREDPKSPHHGFCEARDNIFHDCTGQQAIEGISFPASDYYRYEFALDETADVPAAVEAGVGPSEAHGVVAPLPMPGNGAIGVDVRSTLRWTPGQHATQHALAFGETNPPLAVAKIGVETAGGSALRMFRPAALKAGTVYYWRVDQVTPEGTVPGDVWRFRTAD